MHPEILRIFEDINFFYEKNAIFDRDAKKFFSRKSNISPNYRRISRCMYETLFFEKTFGTILPHTIIVIRVDFPCEYRA